MKQGAQGVQIEVPNTIPIHLHGSYIGLMLWFTLNSYLPGKDPQILRPQGAKGLRMSDYVR